MHEKTVYEEFAKRHAPHGQEWVFQILDCGLVSQAKQHLEDGVVIAKDFSSEKKFISSIMKFAGLGGDQDMLKNTLELIWQPNEYYDNTKRFGCTYRQNTNGKETLVTVGCIFS
ncbi:unnamed protein product [Heligmosomoides polygyrus]|uniref:SCP domain-containing protein n=1 Tax=Heligmosomoides polygyrus TaxID=6339 RepID=A0A183FYR5_HELPZ|nr:unnamed protein product [Heligmosomoides polygyrus]